MFARLTEPLRRRGLQPGVVLAYGAVVAAFLCTLTYFYIPGKGLTYLISFGANQEEARISKIRKLDYYVAKASDGYDAQYYVQIAMDPSLQNQGLRRAVDSLSYRGRRILFSTTAYVFGLGQPAWILQAFALQNAVAWLLLAVLLLHWFPPRDWDNFLRWAGVLLCAGVTLSYRNALFDGPSLLVIAFGVYLLERGRPWAATAVLALAGLGKETNLMGGAALLPGRKGTFHDWVSAAGRGVLLVTPLVLWISYIALAVGGKAGDLGARNFDLPFAAYLRKWREVVEVLPEFSVANPGPLWSLLMLIALTAQFLYLVARPQWDRAWWRIGFSYAMLMVFLGDAVWEGYPGAASRVLLPMQLAFNILVPAGRGWRVLLLLGNLTLLTAPDTLQAPAGEGYAVRADSAMLEAPGGGKFALVFDEGWYATEQSSSSTWKWSANDATILLRNPHARALSARFRFGLTTQGTRELQLLLNHEEIWRAIVPAGGQVSVTLPNIVLPPGESLLELVTDRPPRTVPPDPRQLTFCLHDLRLDGLKFVP